MVKRGVVVVIFSIVAASVVTAGHAVAFSILGFNFGSVQPPADVRSQAAETGISQQANNFLNSIVANASENACLQYTNHEYEVCTAYIFNSAMADLVPYYKYAQSPDAPLARLVSYRLDSRYTGQANALIRDRVAAWPSGANDVEVPSIRILSVNASLANDSATLQTVETWRVASESGGTVYEETDAYHTVTMARVQSYILHKWVVTVIQ